MCPRFHDEDDDELFKCFVFISTIHYAALREKFAEFAFLLTLVDDYQSKYATITSKSKDKNYLKRIQFFNVMFSEIDQKDGTAEAATFPQKQEIIATVVAVTTPDLFHFRKYQVH